MDYSYRKTEVLFKYLKELGLEGLTQNEKKNIHKTFYEYENMEQVKREIELLFAINRSLIGSYETISVNNILSLYRSTDTDLLIKLYSVYAEIKDRSKDEIEARRNFKKAVTEIMSVNEIVNEEIARGVDDTFKKSLELKESLYLTMIDKHKADKLFNNCIRRSKNFIRDCEYRNLEKIIYCLKKDFSFTDEELVSISSRCASFFVSSNVSKINNLHKSLEEFREFITTQSTKMSTALEVKKLLSKDFKEVLKESSSVATITSENLNKTLKFLMGEKLGNLTACGKKTFELRGDFTPVQLAKIYNESITTLGVTVEKISDVATNISEVYKRTYNKELDLSKLINGNNYTSISQLSKDDYLQDKKIEEIFEVLSMFISAEDMENLLRNNFSFLIAPSSAVKKSLQEAVLNSGNKDDLKKNVLQKIRNHFDIYDKLGANVIRAQKPSSEISLNKVGVKNFEEEEIKVVLEKLQTSSEDIETWEKKWNKEEKEYRDLAIQIDLEDVNEQIKGIKELSKIDFINQEQFISELSVVKELFAEVDAAYKEIVEGKKLSKNLRLLAEKTYDNLESARTLINSNISKIVAMYEEEVDLLSKELGSTQTQLDKAGKQSERRKELDALIEERGITIEKMKKNSSTIEDINDFCIEIDSTIREILTNEKKADALVSKYFVFLREEGKQEMLKKGLEGKSIGVTDRLLSRLFPMFVYSLEVEGLIEDADLSLGNSYNVPKIPYKQYRMELNDQERAYTDFIYKIYRENCEKKALMRKKSIEYLAKYGIRSEGLDSTHDKLAELGKFLHQVEEELGSDKRIIHESDKFDEKEISERIVSLLEEQEKLEKSISDFCSKIDLLTKEKISR